jgi:hypothetical protein
MLGRPDTKPLSAYSIEEGAFLHLYPRPEGRGPSAAGPGVGDQGAYPPGFDPNVLPPELMAQFQRELELARIIERGGDRVPEGREMELQVWRGAPVELLRWRNSTKLVCSILVFYFGIGLSAAAARLLSPSSASRDADAARLGAAAAVALGTAQLLADGLGVLSAFRIVKAAATLDHARCARMHRVLKAVCALEMVVRFRWGDSYDSATAVFAVVFDQSVRLLFFVFCCNTVRNFLRTLALFRARTGTGAAARPPGGGQVNAGAAERGGAGGSPAGGAAAGGGAGRARGAGGSPPARGAVGGADDAASDLENPLVASTETSAAAMPRATAVAELV